MMECKSCQQDKPDFTSRVCPDCMHENARDNMNAFETFNPAPVNRRAAWGPFYGARGPSHRPLHMDRILKEWTHAKQF